MKATDWGVPGDRMVPVVGVWSFWAKRKGAKRETYAALVQTTEHAQVSGLGFTITGENPAEAMTSWWRMVNA